jgi:hypothetical protein
MKPYIVFAVCALIAAFSACQFHSSYPTLRRDIALWLLVVSGLAAIVVPLVLALTDKQKHSD